MNERLWEGGLAAEPAAAPAPMKGLYIAESDKLRVTVDHDVLRIEQDGRAPWFIQPKRVERAVLWGNISMDTGAIGLLLANDIPISFLDRNGTTLGIAWSPLTRLSSGEALIERRRRDPEWADAYRKLLDSWVRTARLAFVRRVDPRTWELWTDKGFRVKDWEVWRAAHLATGHPAEWVNLPWRYLRSLLWETATAALLRDGFDPHKGVLDPRQRFGMVREMVQPLLPWVDSCVHWGARSGVLDRSVVDEEGELRMKPAAVRRWTARFEANLPWIDLELKRQIEEVLDLARDWQPPVGRPRKPPRLAATGIVDT